MAKRGRDTLTLETQRLNAGFHAYWEASKPLERITAEMNYKWGPGELEKLVEPDLAAKLERQYRKLDEAVAASDLLLAARLTHGLVRGYTALDAAALAAGHVPSKPVVWTVRREDGVFKVVQTIAETYKVDKGDHKIISVEELLNLRDGIRAGIFDKKPLPKAKEPVDTSGPIADDPILI